ncbi:MAG: hypothetical protein ACXVA9_04285 [Bdellovibrionales bacterium]
MHNLSLMFFFALTGFISSAAFAGPGGLPSSLVHCEILLSSPEETSTGKTWLKNIIEPVQKWANARIEDAVLPQTLNELGLPVDKDLRLWMTIRPPALETESYWIDLKSPKGILKSYGIHVPPLFVWKEDSLEDDTTGLRQSFKPNAIENISFGAVMREVVGGRQFISLKSSPQGELTVTVGVDVDCKSFELFTRQPPEFVLTLPDRELLCRIVVVSAKFGVGGDTPYKGVN